MQRQSKEILPSPIERSRFIEHFNLQPNGERSLFGTRSEDYVCMETWHTDMGYTIHAYTYNTESGKFVYPVGGGVIKKPIDFTKPIFSKPNIKPQKKFDSFSVVNSKGKCIFSSRK